MAQLGNINRRYNIEGLIKKVKMDAMMPKTQSTYDNERFAYTISNELENTVISDILSLQVDLLLTYKDYDFVVGQNRYQLPSRAIGQKVKTVQLVWPNGYQHGQPSFTHVPIFDVTTQGSENWATSSSWGAYIEGNDLVFYPGPLQQSNPAQFRVYYFRRPNALVQAKEGAYITAVFPDTNTISLANIPSGEYNWTVGDLVDVVSPAPPFKTVLQDAQITAINGYDFTLDSIEGISVGDTIALAEFSIIPQIPVELHQYLVQCSVCKCLEGLGDANVKIAAEKLNALKHSIFAALTPRVDSDPEMINNSAGIGLYNKPATRWRG